MIGKRKPGIAGTDGREKLNQCSYLRFPEDVHLRFPFCVLTISPDKKRVEEQV